MTKTITLPIDDVVFVKELYPRLREDDAAIERYRAAIDLLPPIVVARGRVLVDGFHRWQAHRREGIEVISVQDLGDLTEPEILNESIRRNATHGQQLSRADKQRLAGRLWQVYADLPHPERVARIKDLLAVSERSVQMWTKDARKFEKEDRQARAWDLWLDCHEQKRIAALIDVDEATVSRWLQERKSAEMQPPESRQHFDVWHFPVINDDAGTLSYFGNMPPQVAENLLWLYTEPGHIVFDPFAGGGAPLEVAKRMGRRVWASDREPSTPMLPIHRHNILEGWPTDAPRTVDFILLDPPYWKQAAGRYSDDPDDLANMSLEDFEAAWACIVKTCAAHLRPGGKLAYIISPSVDGNDVVDHAYRMHGPCEDAELVPTRRIIVTYNTQQATGQQVTWARENKYLLKLYRDIVVFTK